MKIMSWNVAGFRACLKKGFSDFLDQSNPDIICLQEVKATEDQFDYRPLGYKMFLNPAERKGYSGTLVFTKEEPLAVTFGMNIKEHDDEGRLMTLEYKDFYLINMYVPNVKRDLSRLNYRMKWEDDLRKYIKKLEETKSVIVCGDFNVAHEPIDIKNDKANIGNAGFTYKERAKMTDLLASGLTDTFRFLYPDKDDSYSWWSYRSGVRERNVGWRLDYFLISNKLQDKLIKADILSDVYGSDHCPISIDIF